MWLEKKQARDAREEAPTNPGKSFVAAKGFWFLLLMAFFLFAIAYIVGFGFQGKELHLYFKDLFFAIGIAFLVTWGFTRLIEVPHVANYVAEKLADLMFGEQYLTSIKSSLPELRKRIDRVLYGEAALGYPWSLYNFVNNQVHEFYSSSFRRNFTVEITCKRTNQDETSWREKTTYLYVRNRRDTKPPIIKIYHKADMIEEVPSDASEEDRKSVFNSRVTNLELRVGPFAFNAAVNDRTKLVRTNGVQEEIRVKWKVGRFYVEYDCEYSIPAEMVAGEDGKELRVEIVEEFLDRTRDDVYYVGVVEPTEDFSLVCDFPEDVRLELLKFSMGDPLAESPVPDIPTQGHGMITINGWLLPGHGGCVAWYGMEQDGARGGGRAAES